MPNKRLRVLVNACTMPANPTGIWLYALELGAALAVREDCEVVFASPELHPAANALTLSWTASAGLRYRVQFKNSVTDGVWQTLGADVVATNTRAFKTDPNALTSPQRFYRVLLVN